MPYIKSISIDESGTKWICTSGGLAVFNENGIPVLIEENISAENHVQVFPNPAKTLVIISSTALTGNTLLSIFNVSGHKVLERQLCSNESHLDISTLPRGVYVVRVQDEKMTEVTKLVKQ